MEDPRMLEQEMVSFTSDIVTLAAGQERQQFRAHQDILERSSEYFRRVLNGRWKDSKDKELTFENFESHLLQGYLHFSYFGKIASKAKVVCAKVNEHDDDSHDDRSDTPGQEREQDQSTSLSDTFMADAYDAKDAELSKIRKTEVDKEYQVLTKMYCFGESVQDAHFQNAVIDGIIARAQEAVVDELGSSNFYYPDASAINTLYEGTVAASSPGRQLMVHMYCIKGQSGWLMDNINGEFLLEFSRRMCDLNGERQELMETFEGLDRCAFHDHAVGGRCDGVEA